MELLAFRFSLEEANSSLLALYAPQSVRMMAFTVMTIAMLDIGVII